MPNREINISEIRRLSQQHTAKELADCLQQAIEGGSNACLAASDQGEAVSGLSMAGFVRGRMEQDQVSVNRAMRMLGQRMRALGTF